MQNKKDCTELERVWSVVSHDLVSPLSIIDTSLDHMDKNLLPMLIESYLAARDAGLNVPIITRIQLKHYQNILESTQSVVAGVRQEVARWDRKLLLKHFKSTNKPFDIVKSVKEAIQHYQTSYCLEDKSLIHVNMEEATVFGNEDLMQYIMFELLANAEYALEANSDENPAVFITSSQDEKNYYLTIKNESASIAAADLNQLFDPFFSTKTSQMGLGLTFCKQAMQHMQGDIVCHTENDAKTIEFKLTFKRSEHDNVIT